MEKHKGIYYKTLVIDKTKDDIGYELLTNLEEVYVWDSKTSLTLRDTYTGELLKGKCKR